MSHLRHRRARGGPGCYLGSPRRRLSRSNLIVVSKPALAVKQLLRLIGIEVHRVRQPSPIKPAWSATLRCGSAEATIAASWARNPPASLSMTLEYAIAHLAVFNPGCQFTVLQIGAFDGSENDPLKDILGLLRWRAVLVEPQPRPFTALQSRYRDVEEVKTFKVAIGDRNGTRSLYYFDPLDGLPDWYEQLASFYRSHLIKYDRMIDVDVVRRIRETEVTVWTFDTLLENAGVEGVDVLQIDVEGYDFELLRLFDVPRRRPAIVQYEHIHLSSADQNSATSLLLENGYRLTNLEQDTLAVLS